MWSKKLGSADQLCSNLPEEENANNDEDDAKSIENVSYEKEGEFQMFL